MTPPNTDHTDSDMNVSIKSDTDPLEAKIQEIIDNLVRAVVERDRIGITLRKLHTNSYRKDILTLLQQEKKEAERLALKEPNDLLRSCFQVACREYALDGENTNWSPLIDRLRDELARQHQIMHPNTKEN